MKFKVGNKVVFTNVKKIKSGRMHELKENVEYVIIGVDRQDGCPYVVVDDAILYTLKSEQKYIEIREADELSHKEYKQLLSKFQYIPKSKMILYLIIQLEKQNQNRSLDLAIDNALAEKNFILLEKLLLIKKENIKHQREEGRG